MIMTRSGDVVMPVSALCSSLAHAGGSVSLKDAKTSPLQSGYQRSVCRVPCAVALLSASESVSYDELARRARCLVEQMSHDGVVTDRLVGLCMQKGYRCWHPSLVCYVRDAPMCH